MISLYDVQKYQKIAERAKKNLEAKAKKKAEIIKKKKDLPFNALLNDSELIDQLHKKVIDG